MELLATNSPACVVGALPARLARRARSVVLFSGMIATSRGWVTMRPATARRQRPRKTQAETVVAAPRIVKEESKPRSSALGRSPGEVERPEREPRPAETRVHGDRRQVRPGELEWNGTG
jgi:hypothetical protein